MSALKKVAEVSATEVEAHELRELEEFANRIDYTSLGVFLLDLVKALRSGKDVALYRIDETFPDSIETKDNN